MGRGGVPGREVERGTQESKDLDRALGSNLGQYQDLIFSADPSHLTIIFQY